MTAGLNYSPKWWLLLPVGIFAQAVVYYFMLGVSGVGSVPINAESTDPT